MLKEYKFTHSRLKIIGAIGLCVTTFGILPLKFLVPIDFETSLIFIPIVALFGMLILLGLLNES